MELHEEVLPLRFHTGDMQELIPHHDLAQPVKSFGEVRQRDDAHFTADPVRCADAPDDDAPLRNGWR